MKKYAEITITMSPDDYRLYSAAPDLLFALEAIVVLDGQWSNDSYAQAERAIAKAKGAIS